MNANTKIDKESSILMPLEDVWAAPDEWSDLPPAEDHTAQHRELEELTARFLAQGGVITQVQSGIRTDDQPTYNRAFEPENGRFTAEQHKEHTAAITKRNDAARTAKEAAVAKRIKELLPLKLGKCEFLHHCGCSEGILQRVLESQFADNPEAMAYKKVSWAERDRQLVEQFKKLQGTMCLSDMAKHLNTSHERLKKLLSTHGIRA